ncbi:MAG: EAL domain-containing protein [Xanthomonadales bacterium]|nr:EAL domain-containing protein [Xanthomonadales bacterium]
MVGTYNPALVVVSYIVAALASFVALDSAGRIAASEGRASHGWLIAGGVAMGVGIWSMHFIGMLAFNLPIPQGYDLFITLYSLVIAIAASLYALYLVSQPHLGRARLVAGALIMGSGIAFMHYTGMAAMRMQPGIHYDPFWFGLSIVIAIAAAGAALWIARRLRRNDGRNGHMRILAALVMGFAIVGMHYTGMAAAQFPAGSICGAALDGGVSPKWLASLVGISSFAILGLAITVSVLDRRLQDRTARLAESLRMANEKLTHLALHDALTGLPNRLLLGDRLDLAAEKAQRESTHFAVLFLDLDGFKAINDAYGHPSGDLVLKSVGYAIRSTVRAQHTVARLGGDEFVILAEVDTPEDAASIAACVLDVLERPLSLDFGELRLSASIGIALYPGDGRDGRDLMASADAAMYYVKDRGRNGYGFFESSMDVGARDQLQLVQELRMAATRGELILHYQPKLKAPDGPLVGVEALMRWQHPRLGTIMPEQFIPMAEKNGLIIELGRWALDEACRQFSEWRRDGRSIPGIAVNLSATQFRAPGLVEIVRLILQSHDIPRGALTLEVTESTAMHDPEESLAILHDLADLGVQISIDDFGTGYSSLLYLKRLPARELKIDRAFIKDLTSETSDAAIVSAIIALGRTLNLEIIAEGVETEHQQRLLTELGCSSLQGFHLGRPVDARTLIDRHASRQPG